MFYGIIIRMQINTEDAEILSGELPRKQLRLKISPL